jgi:hypothetical protein
MLDCVKRPIRIEGDAAYVSLTKGYEAVISVSDVPLVDGFNWYAMVQGRSRVVYAVRKDCSSGKMRTVLMHRVIARAPDGMEVDHINGNGLDNRPVNLRLATKSQNTMNRTAPSHNTSGVKGVYFNKARSKWQAQITVGGKTTALGRFDTLELASAAYAKANANFHGDFGRTA